MLGLMKTNKNNNLATKEDIKELEASTKADIERLGLSTKTDIERLESSTKAEIKGLESSTKAQIERFEASTKADINRLEASTKDNIKKLQSNMQELQFSTKDDVQRLNKKIGNVEKRLVNYVNQRAKLAEKFGHEDLVSELAKFEHRINDYLDKVIKEVSESREDRVLLSHRVYEHDGQLENHEDRIVFLEKPVVTA